MILSLFVSSPHRRKMLASAIVGMLATNNSWEIRKALCILMYEMREESTADDPD
jgi:hypothetical protein